MISTGVLIVKVGPAAEILPSVFDEFIAFFDQQLVRGMN